MAKRRSKTKLPSWYCAHGCDLSRRPCRHIEALLPQPNNGSISKEDKQTLALLQKLEKGDVQDEYEAQCKLLEARLIKLRIMPERADTAYILVDRFVSGLSLQEITEKYGFISRSAANYFLKLTLEEMRSRGLEVAKRLLGDYE